MTTQTKPRFLLAAERVAEKLGIDAQDVLDADRAAVIESSYPSSECLLPYEVETMASSKVLAPARLEHIEACAMCWALIESAAGDENELATFLQRVRRERYEREAEELVTTPQAAVAVASS